MEKTKKPMITDLFIEGARKGWTIATTSTVPNVVMAFVIIKMLSITGALDVIGTVLSPVMAIFGVPGEAATVLIAAWLSMAGAVGVLMALFGDGIMVGSQVVIMVPALFLVGSQVQYLGRILGTIETKGSHIPVMVLISYINAFGAMFVMNILT